MGRIDKAPEAVRIPNQLLREMTWCAHTRFPREVRRTMRDPEVLAMGTERRSRQMVVTIVVGGKNGDYCSTCVEASAESRACSPNATTERRDRTQTEVDRQLRWEWMAVDVS